MAELNVSVEFVQPEPTASECELQQCIDYLVTKIAEHRRNGVPERSLAKMQHDLDYATSVMMRIRPFPKVVVHSNADLLDRARRNPPPAEWYDSPEEDCPFVEDVDE